MSLYPEHSDDGVDCVSIVYSKQKFPDDVGVGVGVGVSVGVGVGVGVLVGVGVGVAVGVGVGVTVGVGVGVIVGVGVGVAVIVGVGVAVGVGVGVAVGVGVGGIISPPPQVTVDDDVQLLCDPPQIVLIPKSYEDPSTRDVIIKGELAVVPVVYVTSEDNLYLYSNVQPIHPEGGVQFIVKVAILYSYFYSFYYTGHNPPPIVPHMVIP